MKQLIIIFELKEGSILLETQIKDKIRKYGSYAFVSNNACIIWTNDSAAIVRDNLKIGFGIGDKLFVGTTSAPAAWLNTVKQEVTDYLQKNLK